jgi:hypothetical protein
VRGVSEVREGGDCGVVGVVDSEVGFDARLPQVKESRSQIVGKELKVMPFSSIR